MVLFTVKLCVIVSKKTMNTVKTVHTYKCLTVVGEMVEHGGNMMEHLLMLYLGGGI